MKKYLTRIRCEGGEYAMGIHPTHPIHLATSYTSGLGRRTIHHPLISMTTKYLYQQAFGSRFIPSDHLMMLYPCSEVMVSSETITTTHSHYNFTHSTLTMDESIFGRFYYA
jgi:hypothetical protein